MVRSSSGWAGRHPFASATYVAATSRAVSDAAQKNAGDSAQPICSADGTTISTGPPGCVGSTYAKFHSWPSSHTKRQNPSEMSSLLNMMSPFSREADAIASMMRGSTLPIWFMAASGAIFLVASFTDGRSYPATLSSKDRSRIALYLRDLCGIIASGESLRLAGRFFLRSSHL